MQQPWVIRTDFSNDAQWSAVCELIAAPQTLFGQKTRAYVQYVSDPQHADLLSHQLVHALPDDYDEFFFFVVDENSLSDKEHPILVVDFAPDSEDLEPYQRTPRQTPLEDIKSLRAIPATIQDIQVNLSLANMDFEEFADAADADGVFRGFTR